jgi:hypothetical protein
MERITEGTWIWSKSQQSRGKVIVEGASCSLIRIGELSIRIGELEAPPTLDSRFRVLSSPLRRSFLSDRRSTGVDPSPGPGKGPKLVERAKF